VSPTVASPFLSRRERFAVVGSTNDVVREWLAEGTPEVCLAVADEQSAGRGREGRTWTAPRGHALLLSLGFRPTWLSPERTWRLAAVASLAMAEAAELVAGLTAGTIRLKWPNDLVVERDGGVLKLAGVLGETDGLGTADPRAVVGIGINADWPRDEFPIEIASSMTSLAAEGTRRVDETELLEAFLASLEPRVDALRAGAFDGRAWSDRQATSGREVRLHEHGLEPAAARAVAVDTESGALLVEDPASPDGVRQVFSADVVHVRLEPGV
jgi:BirA family transcriptional regulator, biotin operon repressor / biotin---[acetyl-CoA-carboxylase] ligase